MDFCEFKPAWSTSKYLNSQGYTKTKRGLEVHSAESGLLQVVQSVFWFILLFFFGGRVAARHCPVELQGAAPPSTLLLGLVHRAESELV